MAQQTPHAQRDRDLPECRPGDQVRVWYRIIERDRVRQAPFEGLVIRRRGTGTSESVTIRRLSHGEGVERVFPLHAPVLERIEVIRRGKVRRGRLYFLRSKIGKTRIASAERGGAAKPSGEAQPKPRPPDDASTEQADRSTEKNSQADKAVKENAKAHAYDKPHSS